MFSWLKKIFPRSLYGRAAVILLLPVLVLQVFLSMVFIQRHYEQVTLQMTRSVALDLEFLLSSYEEQPTESVAWTVASHIARGLEFALTDLEGAAPEGHILPIDEVSGRTMVATLTDELPQITRVDLSLPKTVQISVETRHGPLMIGFDRRRVTPSNPHQLLVLTTVLSVILSLISYIFLKNQLRPIRRLAAVASEYGKGRILPYRPSGSTEVRIAGAAFLEMRGRIERQVQQRTLLLSGVSHDLRTPLTRLRLGLTMSDDPEAEEMLRDVEEMQHMLDAFLDFARGEAEAEMEEVDALEVVRTVVREFNRFGAQVELGHFEGQGLMFLRSAGLRRGLENLVNNALRYGTKVRVSAVLAPRSLRVTVEDNGPGIAPEAREEAMRPFTQLDPARNQDGGSGVGLGLAIVADIARMHGGQLRLGESQTLKGLRADLIFAR